MKFCNECNNMLYTRIDQEDNSLQYNCKNCGFESEKSQLTADSCIYKKDYDLGEISYEYMINEFTCEDPTLPRVNDIKCVNKDCVTNTPDYPENEREVVFIKYDKKKMNFVYICCKCKTVWKNIV